MTWDKLWAINKKVIDPVAPRHTALDARALVKATVEGAAFESKQFAAHPKNAAVGSKTVWMKAPFYFVQSFILPASQVAYGPNILIEGADAYTLSVGETITLMEWGNASVTHIERNKYTVRFLGN